MKRVYEILVKDMYKVELNGVALMGFLVSSIYGAVYMTINLVKIFQ